MEPGVDAQVSPILIIHHFLNCPHGKVTTWHIPSSKQLLDMCGHSPGAYFLMHFLHCTPLHPHCPPVPAFSAPQVPQNGQQTSADEEMRQQAFTLQWGMWMKREMAVTLTNMRAKYKRILTGNFNHFYQIPGSKVSRNVVPPTWQGQFDMPNAGT